VETASTSATAALDQKGREVTSLGPTRGQLISKAVPLFGEFMRRIMPGDDWRR